MAELATVARPYAEALFQAAGDRAASLVDSMDLLATVAADPGLRQFAGHPRTAGAQVAQMVVDVLGAPLEAPVANLLQLAIENRRLAALPEIAAQFRALVNARAGICDARIVSAFPLSEAQLAQVVVDLERRFGRKLRATVAVDPSLIGGIRAEVGDEVLDASVQARLEKMKSALAR